MKIIDQPDRGIITHSAIARGVPLGGIACYGLWSTGVIGSGRPIGTVTVVEDGGTTRYCKPADP